MAEQVRPLVPHASKPPRGRGGCSRCLARGFVAAQLAKMLLLHTVCVVGLVYLA
jgi:hypothetical protein